MFHSMKKTYRTIEENTRQRSPGIVEIDLRGLSPEDSLRAQGAGEFLIFNYKMAESFQMTFVFMLAPFIIVYSIVRSWFR